MHHAHHPFAPHDAGPPGPLPPPVPGVALGPLRSAAGRLRRRFFAVNAGIFLLVLLLGWSTDGPLATEVVGRVNAGMLLCLLQLVVLVVGAVLFDRGAERTSDRIAARVRAQSAEQQRPVGEGSAFSARSQQRSGPRNDLGSR